MPVETDFAYLAESILEQTAAYLGKDTLSALAVEVNPRTCEASVEIKLRDASEASRRRALESFAEVESLFWDEVALRHNFVGELHESQRALADARRRQVLQFA